MNRDRMPLVGAGLALLVLVVLVTVDLSIPPGHAVLTSLFGLSPLIACAVVPVPGTAAIGALAIGAAFASGWWNDTMGTAQQNVRILDVVMVSIAAVAIAAVRVHREHQFAQLSAIAEAAQRAILPVLPTHLGGVAVATRYRSAARGTLVGGDLFDCYHSESRVRFLIGDVRGKGIAGVEQAARVIRAFRQSAALRESLTDVAREMDDYLADFFGEEEFVTALLVEVSGPGQLTLHNAGHPPPQLVRTTGESELIDLPRPCRSASVSVPAGRATSPRSRCPGRPGTGCCSTPTVSARPATDPVASSTCRPWLTACATPSTSRLRWTTSSTTSPDTYPAGTSRTTSHSCSSRTPPPAQRATTRRRGPDAPGPAVLPGVLDVQRDPAASRGPARRPLAVGHDLRDAEPRRRPFGCLW